MSFEQTGGAPHKKSAKVRWCIDGDRRSLAVRYQENTGEWVNRGTLDIEDVEYVEQSFNDKNDRWIILRYKPCSGPPVQLVSEGPHEVDGNYYYKLIVEQKMPNGQFRAVNDSLIDEMPKINSASIR